MHTNSKPLSPTASPPRAAAAGPLETKDQFGRLKSSSCRRLVQGSELTNFENWKSNLRFPSGELAGCCAKLTRHATPRHGATPLPSGQVVVHPLRPNP
jgi:hypothetical protein